MKNSQTCNLVLIGVLSFFSLTGHLQAASEFADGVVPIELVREIAGGGEF